MTLALGVAGPRHEKVVPKSFDNSHLHFLGDARATVDKYLARTAIHHPRQEMRDAPSSQLPLFRCVSRKDAAPIAIAIFVAKRHIPTDYRIAPAVNGE